MKTIKVYTIDDGDLLCVFEDFMTPENEKKAQACLDEQKSWGNEAWIEIG